MNNTIKLAIQQINDLSDQKMVAELSEKLSWFNVNDPNNKKIFELARQKGLI